MGGKTDFVVLLDKHHELRPDCNLCCRYYGTTHTSGTFRLVPTEVTLPNESPLHVGLIHDSVNALVKRIQ